MSATRRRSGLKSKGTGAASPPHPAGDAVLACGSRPSVAAHRYHFVAVEEASAVSRRAKALACRSTCTSAAASASASRPGSSASVGPPPDGPAAAAGAQQPKAAGSKQPGTAALSPALAAPRYIDWESADEEEVEEVCSATEHGQHCSNESAVGSGSTAGARPLNYPPQAIHMLRSCCRLLAPMCVPKKESLHCCFTCRQPC